MLEITKLKVFQKYLYFCGITYIALIIIKRISITFLQIHFFCTDTSGFLGSLACIWLWSNTIGRKMSQIMYRARFVIFFERILTFKIKSSLFKGTHHNFIKFIILLSTIGSSDTISSNNVIPFCFWFKIENRWRETRNNDSYMQEGWKIEILERESEKHLGHLCLYETRWSKRIDDFQILIQDFLDGCSLPASEDILSIVCHAYDDTEEIFSRTRKCIASSASSSGWTSYPISLSNICPVLRKHSIVTKGYRRVRIDSNKQLRLHITQETNIKIIWNLTQVRTFWTIFQESRKC